MPSLVAAILALYLGFFAVALTWLVLCLPLVSIILVGALVFGSQASTHHTMAVYQLLFLPVIVWAAVRFVIPAYIEVIRLAWRILVGDAPSKPMEALAVVSARQQLLRRDLGRVWGWLHA